MWIVQLALRRPYTFIVAALLLLITAPLVLLKTPTDIFPEINIPVISVIWQYQGLSAQEIERRLVYVHERVLTTTVNDIEHIESNSLDGVGVIKIFFQPGASIDAATAQVTAVSQTILRQMPAGTTPPLIIRYNASNVPIMQFGLSSSTLSEQEIFDLAMNTMRVALVTVPGVAIPYPYGGKSRLINVDLDMHALQARGLTPTDVINTIAAQNLVLPSGTAKIGSTIYDVDLNGSPGSVQELNDLPIKAVNGTVLYIHDVAQVHDGAQPQQNVVRQNGQRGVLVTVFKSGNASTLDVVKGVKAALPNVLSTLPKALNVRLLVDQSIFVRGAISGVVREGAIAAALTALMILLFLGSWRSTLIIAISIPLSILASIAALSALGETINLMTLGGLALAVGILVDDATVTIENIERHLKQGAPLEEGILTGAGEIALPALVSTLCICIVFVPMFFLSGVAKFLFVPLAEAVVFAMLASYVLSRTLIPTLVMYLLKSVHGKEGETDPARQNVFVRFQKGFEVRFERFRYRYAGILRGCLHHRGLVCLAALLFFAASWLLVPFLGQDFFPSVDAGQIALHFRGKSGTRIEETAKLADKIDEAVRNVIPPDDLAGIVDNLGVPISGINLSYSNTGVIGPSDGDLLISLKEDHHRGTASYVNQLRLALAKDFPGTLFYFLPADIVSQTLNFGLPAPFDIQINGRNQQANRLIAAKLAAEIQKVRGAVDVRVQQPADEPRLSFDINRTKAAELNLTARDVANNVLLTLSGNGVVQPSFYLDPTTGVSYSISTQAPERTINSLSALTNIAISGPTAQSVDLPAGTSGQLLQNVVTMKRSMGPVAVSHFNVMPVIDIFGGVSGRDLGGVMQDIQPLIEKTRNELPRGSFIHVRGQALTMQDSFAGLAVGLVGAIVLVYLLLVVNFQSWADPFIIISALPGALCGVIWMLFTSQTTLSVPALMGAIMCLGVATANSVLVVSFAKTALESGKDAINAALDSGASRLRPVLMTALAMIIGMVPMALGLGEGGEQNAPLGRAVIGGLIIATATTLFFVPVVFAIIHNHLRGRSRRHAPANEPHSATT